MKKQFYAVVVVFIVLAFLAGCSNTSEVAEQPQAQEAVPEPAIVSKPAQAEPAPDVTLDTVFYFDFDDATVRPDVRQAIEAHVERLKTHAKLIRIEGHADERGTDAYNKELGMRRADAIRDLLISMGVSSSQIETVSFGEKNPVVLGSGEAVWEKNRRVELTKV
ncbi:MAG: OmpA family protein [Gammaproteobacteria bacterium]|nr:OmpA family protein [Gammaproteobacteria bacterium]